MRSSVLFEQRYFDCLRILQTLESRPYVSSFKNDVLSEIPHIEKKTSNGTGINEKVNNISHGPASRSCLWHKTNSWTCTEIFCLLFFTQNMSGKTIHLATNSNYSTFLQTGRVNYFKKFLKKNGPFAQDVYEAEIFIYLRVSFLLTGCVNFVLNVQSGEWLSEFVYIFFYWQWLWWIECVCYFERVINFIEHKMIC